MRSEQLRDILVIFKHVKLLKFYYLCYPYRCILDVDISETSIYECLFKSSWLNCIIFILWFIALGWYFRGLCSIIFIQILFLCCNLECEFRILQLRFFYSGTNYFLSQDNVYVWLVEETERLVLINLVNWLIQMVDPIIVLRAFANLMNLTLYEGGRDKYSV